MEKATLETVVERLDRLEKAIAEVNQQLSWLVNELVRDAPKDCDTDAVDAAGAQNDKQDANRGVKVIAEIFKKMGISEDFEPRPLEEVRKSMVESGIRPEDNEFSRAIIAEREK